VNSKYSDVKESLNGKIYKNITTSSNSTKTASKTKKKMITGNIGFTSVKNKLNQKYLNKSGDRKTKALVSPSNAHMWRSLVEVKPEINVSPEHRNYMSTKELEFCKPPPIGENNNERFESLEDDRFGSADDTGTKKTMMSRFTTKVISGEFPSSLLKLVTSKSKEYDVTSMEQNSIESNHQYHSKDEITNRKISKKPISKTKLSKNRVSSAENLKASMKIPISLSKSNLSTLIIGIGKFAMKNQYETTRNKNVIMMLEAVNKQIAPQNHNKIFHLPSENNPKTVAKGKHYLNKMAVHKNSSPKHQKDIFAKSQR
jgi:hypothetical protein